MARVPRRRGCFRSTWRAAGGPYDAVLTNEEIDALFSGRDADTFTSHERLTRRIVRQLLLQRDLDDDIVEEARTSIGLAQASELLMLVGYYGLLALSLGVWRTPSPAPDPFSEETNQRPPEPSDGV